jgi:hypothetical protein
MRHAPGAKVPKPAQYAVVRDEWRIKSVSATAAPVRVGERRGGCALTDAHARRPPQSRPLCRRCNQALGAYEPIVVLDGTTPRGTSLVKEAVTPLGDCYHDTCFQIERARRALDELGEP